MSHQSELIATDIDAYLAQHERKQLLRFITCGSVDDGKSTLIGRLLYDSKMLYEDQLAHLEVESKTQGTTGGKFDPALVTDGLKAEREQGITIDVAYRYFSTARRKFIIADTPGHEQYTRNMATGASTADLAVILVDARHGVLTQTRRHSFIVSLLGIHHVVVAVNKMDLCDFSEDRFEEICDDYRSFATRLDLPDVHFIPISALDGDNVVDASPRTPWYRGTTLMNLLETVYIGSDRNLRDFRLPVQYVNRPNLNFRGFCGTIASGTIREGDDVMILPSRQKTRVKKIVSYDGDMPEAFAPLAVTLTLADEVDASRGDMIVRPGNVPKTSDTIEAIVVWMDQSAMVPGKKYLFKHTTQTVPGSIDTLRYRIDVNTLHRAPSPKLDLNEIGRVRLTLGAPIHFDPYATNRGTGAFIIIDRITNVTVGAGMIIERGEAPRSGAMWEEDLAGSSESRGATEEASDVSQEERQSRFGQKPLTVLFTGLTGSGKTTLARAVERQLFDAGRAVSVLDGSWVRRGLSRDLGYSAEDRSENLRRAAHLAHILNDAGLICLAAFVAPDEEVRNKVGALIGHERFLVVHVATPLDVCRARDQSGQYEKADEGELPNFPGVTAPYQPPTSPDLVVDLESLSLKEAVKNVVALVEKFQA